MDSKVSDGIWPSHYRANSGGVHFITGEIAEEAAPSHDAKG